MVGDVLAFLNMVLVLVVILFGAYFTTRFTATRLGGAFTPQGGKLALVHRLSLGREQQLLVVKVADRHLLLGCTASQISLLTELTEEESTQLFSDNAQAEGIEPPSFSEILRNLRGKDSHDNDPRKG